MNEEINEVDNALVGDNELQNTATVLLSPQMCEMITPNKVNVNVDTEDKIDYTVHRDVEYSVK